MNSRDITVSDVTWIVKIMCEDPELGQRREILCRALGLPQLQLTDIARDKTADSDTRLYLTRALDIWVSNSVEPTFEKLTEVLRDEDFNLAADELIKKQSELPPICTYNLEQDPVWSSMVRLEVHDVVTHSHESSLPVWFDVPDDVHMFAGRVDDMQKLHESIIGQNLVDAKNDMTVITAVCGMGGVGKTSLTIRYAWAFVKIFYVNVIWINSETPNTISNSFNRLAKELGQQNSSELHDVVSAIYKYFGYSKTLVIFDNAESYENVKSYIPSRSAYGLRPYVLLTSRNQVWNFRTHKINLNVFKVEESVEFFKAFLGLQTEQEFECAERISSVLQNLPLAIRQAGAYIKLQHRDRYHNGSIVDEMKSYIDAFELNSAQVLQFEHWVHTADIYEQTVYSTWTISITKLKQQNYATKTIIEFISYLNSDSIPIKLLYNLRERNILNRLMRRVIQTSEVNSAVKLLSDFSLITEHSETDSISVHRLLQKVVRDQVQRKCKGSQFDGIISIIKIPIRLSNYDYYEDICLIHALSVIAHIRQNRLQTRNIQTFQELVSSKQNNSVDKRLNFLSGLLEQGKFLEMIEHFEKTNKLYVTHGSTLNNSTNELFTIRFASLICTSILRDWQLSLSHDGILQKCQIIKNVLRDSRISFSAAFQESHVLRKSAEDMYRMAGIESISPSSASINDSFLSTAYCILDTLFEYLKNNYNHSDCVAISDIGCRMLTIGIDMSAFSEIRCFIEDFNNLPTQLEHEIFSDMSDSTLHTYKYCLDKLFSKVQDMKLVNTEVELLRNMTTLLTKVCSSYENRNNFTAAVQCGPVIIEYQIELNTISEISRTVNSFQNILSDWIKSSDSHSSEARNISIDLAGTIYRSASHPNCKSIRSSLLSSAAYMYKLILSQIQLGSYDEVWFNCQTGIFNCFVALDGTSDIHHHIKKLQYTLGRESKDVENFDLTYIFKYVEHILLCAEGSELENITNTIFMDSVPVTRILYEFSWNRPFTSKLPEISVKIIRYLSVQKCEDIFAYIMNYQSLLDKVIPIEGVADVSNIYLADTIYTAGEHFEESGHTTLVLQAYVLYNRVFMFDSIINQKMVNTYITKCLTVFTSVFHCLTKTNHVKELLDFIKVCAKCLEFLSPRTRSFPGVAISELIVESAKHPNCSNEKSQLIMQGLYICSLCSVESPKVAMKPFAKSSTC